MVLIFLYFCALIMETGYEICACDFVAVATATLLSVCTRVVFYAIGNSDCDCALLVFLLNLALSN